MRRRLQLFAFATGLFTGMAFSGINWKAVWLEPRTPVVLTVGETQPYTVMGLNGADVKAELTKSIFEDHFLRSRHRGSGPEECRPDLQDTRPSADSHFIQRGHQFCSCSRERAEDRLGGECRRGAAAEPAVAKSELAP